MLCITIASNIKASNAVLCCHWALMYTTDVLCTVAEDGIVKCKIRKHGYSYGIKTVMRLKILVLKVLEMV